MQKQQIIRQEESAQKRREALGSRRRYYGK